MTGNLAGLTEAHTVSRIKRGFGVDAATGPVSANVLPVDTGVVEATPTVQPGRTWRPWTIWLPGVLALVWSLLLIVADNLAGVMGSWDTPSPGLRWLWVGVVGHCVLAAASVLVLAVGLSSPSRRRAAVITAWMIIPVGFGWALLTGHLISGS